ncbi:hypothetical protein [Psychroflexus maritimus]|uniref:Uncharacterized protein n=1 Tax=Psychroflexus maritimus TaxID=2714865 RepID=A0A967AC18_9FLAO|nr:hypothetical protein [Psychroflexus maritimus]NGZ88900.1 hypothetical protein [Psychroflexus maritimus]
MKSKFYMYGFVFASLIALLMYFNSKKTYEAQAREIDLLKTQIEQLKKDCN